MRRVIPPSPALPLCLALNQGAVIGMGLLSFGAGGRGRLSLRTLRRVIPPSPALPPFLALNQGAVTRIDPLSLSRRRIRSKARNLAEDHTSSICPSFVSSTRPEPSNNKFINWYFLDTY